MNSQQIFDETFAEADSLNIRYEKVRFPLRYTGAGIFVAEKAEGEGTVEFKMTGPGYTYIMHSLGAYDRRGEFASRKTSPWQWAEEVTEWANAVMPYEDFVAVIVDGKLKGFPKDYNIVDHRSVLEFVRECSLVHRLYGAVVSPYEMSLYLGFSRAGNDVQWGIKINNGMTGHVSLNFQGYIKIGDWEQSLTEKTVVKHLSNVPKFYEDFVDFADEILGIEVDIALDETPASVAIDVLNAEFQAMDYDEWEKVSDLEKQLNRYSFYYLGENPSAMDVLVQVSQHIEYGKKPLVRGLMNKAAEEVFTHYQANLS